MIQALLETLIRIHQSRECKEPERIKMNKYTHDLLIEEAKALLITETEEATTIKYYMGIPIEVFEGFSEGVTIAISVK